MTWEIGDLAVYVDGFGNPKEWALVRIVPLPADLRRSLSAGSLWVEVLYSEDGAWSREGHARPDCLRAPTPAELATALSSIVSK